MPQQQISKSSPAQAQHTELSGTMTKPKPQASFGVDDSVKILANIKQILKGDVTFQAFKVPGDADCELSIGSHETQLSVSRNDQGGYQIQLSHSYGDTQSIKYFRFDSKGKYLGSRDDAVYGIEQGEADAIFRRSISPYLSAAFLPKVGSKDYQALRDFLGDKTEYAHVVKSHDKRLIETTRIAMNSAREISFRRKIYSLGQDGKISGVIDQKFTIDQNAKLTNCRDSRAGEWGQSFVDSLPAGPHKLGVAAVKYLIKQVTTKP